MTTNITDEKISRLEELFAGLPGLGPRSASRIVAELLTTRRQDAQRLCQDLSESGVEIEYTDAATIASAVAGRR